MGQSFFQFKQFLIHQDKTAMKVTTEACLFGAYLAKHYEGNNLERVLDIGAGTGLLSLMFVQKNPKAQINAVEIDPHAALQCQENFERSPWIENLHLTQDSIQNYQKSETQKFDIILSNPPFHENQLKGTNQTKTLAHHSTELSLNELFEISSNLLEQKGLFWIILPTYRHQEAEELSKKHGFEIQNKVWIKPSPTHPKIRVIMGLKKETKDQNPIESEIFIREINGEYSPIFKDLIWDYYL